MEKKLYTTKDYRQRFDENMIFGFPIIIYTLVYDLYIAWFVKLRICQCMMSTWFKNNTISNNVVSSRNECEFHKTLKSQSWKGLSCFLKLQIIWMATNLDNRWWESVRYKFISLICYHLHYIKGGEHIFLRDIRHVSNISKLFHLSTTQKPLCTM